MIRHTKPKETRPQPFSSSKQRSPLKEGISQCSEGIQSLQSLQHQSSISTIKPYCNNKEVDIPKRKDITSDEVQCDNLIQKNKTAIFRKASQRPNPPLTPTSRDRVPTLAGALIRSRKITATQPPSERAANDDADDPDPPVTVRLNRPRRGQGQVPGRVPWSSSTSNSNLNSNLKQ